MVESYSLVWLGHILFILPSADGRLDCFHFLAVLSNAAANVSAHVFEVDVSSVGVGFLGHMVILC